MRLAKEPVAPWLGEHEAGLRTSGRRLDRIVVRHHNGVTFDAAWLQRVLREVTNERQLGAHCECHARGVEGKSEHPAER